MKNVVNGEGLDCLKKSIAQKYGKDLAVELFNNLETLINTDKNQSDNEYNAALAFEKTCLKFVEQDINNLNSKEDVKNFIEIYRNYKCSLLGGITDSEETIDFTNKIFNLDRLDCLLADKIIKYDVLNFSSNPNLNKMAIKSLLVSKKQPYHDKEGYYSYYTTTTLDNALFNYTESDGIGDMTLYYKNPYDDQMIQFHFIFDGSSFLTQEELQNHKNLDSFHSLDDFSKNITIDIGSER